MEEYLNTTNVSVQSERVELPPAAGAGFIPISNQIKT